MNLKRTLVLVIFSFMMLFVKAQSGLNFQGVARSSNNTILASQPISLRLSIIQGSANGVTEYVEIRKVNTNAQGLFSLVIGDEEATNTVGSISNINWKNTPKYLKIEMDAAAGNNFTIIGTTQFQYVAYAQFAKSVDAENIIGTLPVSKGGTGLSSISELKSALALDKINNTADIDKPISAKTQAALDLISVTATDTARFLKRIDSKADTADVSVITKTLGTKLNAADTIKYTKQVYSDSALLTILKITDTSTMLSSRIARDTLNLSKRINFKANTTDLTLGLELKENISNKSTASDLGGISPSDVLFPTQKAVKDYITANNPAGGIADGGITSIKIADAAVNFQKFQTIPANTILGNTTSSQASLQAITTTGTDNIVLSTSPTLVSPNLGQATATSINNVSINTLNGTASITVRGETTLRGNNNGDDAPNQHYENIIADGIVSLTTNQPIDGQKTFQNNLVMGNIGGLAGTSSPTTIDFANGSRIGDLDNINNGNPDLNGSIDLYAPDGAKWVELNYANRNYIAVTDNKIGFWVDNNEWEFNNFGITKIPYHTFLGGNIYFSQDGITENHNASIESNGPLLKIYARSETSREDSIDVDYGIQLNFADKSRIDLLDDFMVSSITDTANKQSSNLILSKNSLSFDFFDEVNSSGNHWAFYGDDGSSSFPGEINVHIGDVDIFEGDLKLSQGKFMANGTSGITGDILTINNAGFPVWQAPTGISSMNNLSDLSQIFAVGTDGADFNISSASGTHTFNIPDASTNNRGLLNSTDYTRFNSKQDAMDYATASSDGYLRSVDFNIFNNKQDLLTNPITGTGTSGQLSFFNGTSSMTSSSNLFWDENNKRLGIRNTSPSYPFEINQESDNYGFMLNAPSGNTWGSTIGFKSNIGNGNITNNGLFQLDGDGAMVFRTYQNQMYFDDFDVNGVINFRIGGEYGIKKGISLNNQGNLYVDGTVSSAGTVLTSDIRLKNNIIPIKNSLHLINQLNPVSYNKKISLSSNDYSISENGFIAQELQKILPDLVHESADKDKLLSVNYTAIIPILTKGIQEQQLEIEELKRELQELKKLIQTRNKRK